MNKDELERRLEAVEKQNLGLLDEIKNLKEQLAEAQDEPEIPDIPEQFESLVVWAMDSKLDVFNYGISPYNESSFNAFHTKEMAQEFADKCKLIAMMLHCKQYLDKDYIPDWKDVNYKYFVYRDPDTDRFDVVAQRRLGTGLVAFSTKENAQKAADWLNEHWKENS